MGCLHLYPDVQKVLPAGYKLKISASTVLVETIHSMTEQPLQLQLNSWVTRDRMLIRSSR